MQPQIRSYNDHASPAIRHLVETAEILAVSEADVFRLAYRHLYERELSEALLDQLFGAYLKRGELPGWVRSYCQRVLGKAATATPGFDPREFGVDSPRRIASRDGQFASFVTFAAFVVFWWLIA